ncbi:chemotaxis protein [Salidesulfovibrio brasiliensis]|uniref:chemotaxis protein n=1 Tax=Salidesulfovibrio brasiliensis TaxID=221711 RepID=UPI0006CFCDC4|nr:chemotaxis protein [Salidesulfovibrio brasiliensis]
MTEQSKKEILLETGTNELEILEFCIDETVDGKPVRSYFGVNVAKVMQVIESPDLEPPESAPHECYLGTIPLRGHILPVVDLAIWLGMNREPGEDDVVIVTEFSQSVTGFLVSGVTQIHRVGWPEVIPPQGLLGSLDADTIIGLVDIEDHFIQLLDLEHILSDLEPSDAIEAWTLDVHAEGAPKALIADDSATIRAMLKNNLEAANFVTRVVNTGEEALDALRAIREQASQEGKPVTDYVDIIISDIEMPRMDGFTLTKNVKEDDVLGRLPVILYSSIITDELRHKGDSVRADAQISKPDMDQMASLAIKLIKERAEAVA